MDLGWEVLFVWTDSYKEYMVQDGQSPIQVWPVVRAVVSKAQSQSSPPSPPGSPLSPAAGG